MHRVGLTGAILATTPSTGGVSVLSQTRQASPQLHLIYSSLFARRLMKNMTAALGTIIIYARDMQKTAAFYSTHFGFKTSGKVVEGLIELQGQRGGAGILIHQAAKSVKLGQAGVKLSFDVQDIDAFIAQAAANGLKFGAVHQAHGYSFANAKDPDQNSISISSRTFRKVDKSDA